jgi:hypothetical protein
MAATGQMTLEGAGMRRQNATLLQTLQAYGEALQKLGSCLRGLPTPPTIPATQIIEELVHAGGIQAVRDYLVEYNSTTAKIVAGEGPPEPVICLEKQRLAEAAARARCELKALHDREIGDCGAGLHRFDLALTLAQEQRDEAQKAYFLHTAVHGC